MRNKILEVIVPILFSPIVILGFILSIIISIFLYPFFRVSTGKSIIFEVPIKIKGLKVGYIFRGPIENILGNKLLFFSEYPYTLFVNQKYIEQLPKEIYNHDDIGYSIKQKQTVVAIFETKKLKFFDGYFPAKLISYKIIDREPEFSK